MGSTGVPPLLPSAAVPFLVHKLAQSEGEQWGLGGSSGEMEGEMWGLGVDRPVVSQDIPGGVDGRQEGGDPAVCAL